MKKYVYEKFIAAFFVMVILLVTTDLYILSVFGVGLFVFIGTKFFYELGNKIEIRDIMILIGSLQWIIGPILTYHFYPNDQFYYMAVEEEVYMNFVVPATTAFSFGLYFPIWAKRTDENVHLIRIGKILEKNKNIDLILIFIGVASAIVENFVPHSIKFLFYLFSGARFVGLYFLLISDRPRKNIIMILLIGWLALTALNDAMFHEFLLWIFFFLVISSFINKPSIRRKSIYFLILLILGIVIQTVKHEFRQLLNEGSGQSTAIFTDLVQDKFVESNYFISDANLSAMVTRVNQGWIIARIMNHTPKYENFADGETITEAIKATFMPRILFPGKISAGGRTYFERFTGKKISDNTSMGLSLMGEAYANYGIFGGIVFMYFIGLFYNYFLFFIFRYAEKTPSIILFIPLIFLQVIKAETDFSVILNHLFKATIAVVILYWLIRRLLGVRL